jgi:hypothetical protein
MPSKTIDQQRFPNWRVALWGGGGTLLTLPAVAMLFTAEVAWGPGDFLLLASLLALGCAAIDLAVRRAPSRTYAAGVLVAVVGMILQVWSNLAVGLVGSEENAINLLFLAIPALGVVGAMMSRWRAAGMARTLRGMAILQLASLVALPAGEPRLLLAIGGFAFLWWSAARLFAAASRPASAR